jgi:hypothetical protein
MYIKFQLEDLKERDYLEDLLLDEGIVLNLILKN